MKSFEKRFIGIVRVHIIGIGDKAFNIGMKSDLNGGILWETA